MNVNEKSAYLKGLAEGIGLDPQKPETKIINALLDLVGDMSAKISELEKDLETLNDYVDELDEDLAYVEDYVYDDEYDLDDYDDDDDFECEACGGDCDECDHAEECYGEDEDEDGFRCLMCPACSEKIYFDESMDPADMICPACGKAVCEDDAPEEV
ncbi:MAG: hypothetical protein IJZ08_05400 [Clostridia bacterium]|nr:hypothetical protein [Clostridia bacterium]